MSLIFGYAVLSFVCIVVLAVALKWDNEEIKSKLFTI